MMISSFKIVKHYEVFSVDGEKSFKMREIEVVVADGKVFKWSDDTRQFFPLASKHMETAQAAYDDWKERVEHVLAGHKRAIGVLEEKLAIPIDHIEVVRE